MDKKYCCVRVERLRDKGAASRMGAHGRREYLGQSHIDPTRTHLNQAGLGKALSDKPDVSRGLEWFPDECLSLLQQQHDARHRKGSAWAAHLICIASPKAFREGLDPHQWAQETVAWAEKKFPGQVASWRLDLDETTPHVDLFVMPVAQSQTKTGKRSTWISYRKVIGGEKIGQATADLQDSYADAMKPLGLFRGELGDRTARRVRKHLPPDRVRAVQVREARKWYRQAEAGEQKDRAFRAGLKAIDAGEITGTAEEKGRFRYAPEISEYRQQEIVKAIHPARMRLWSCLRAVEKTLGPHLQKARQAADAVLSDVRELHGCLPEAGLSALRRVTGFQSNFPIRQERGDHDREQ